MSTYCVISDENIISIKDLEDIGSFFLLLRAMTYWLDVSQKSLILFHGLIRIVIDELEKHKPRAIEDLKKLRESTLKDLYRIITNFHEIALESIKEFDKQRSMFLLSLVKFRDFERTLSDRWGGGLPVFVQRILPITRIEEISRMTDEVRRSIDNFIKLKDYYQNQIRKETEKKHRSKKEIAIALAGILADLYYFFDLIDRFAQRHFDFQFFVEVGIVVGITMLLIYYFYKVYKEG
jgi:hypothetical protein